MEGEEDPVAMAIDLQDPAGNDHLRYAIDLFNHGYFWESHVYFEAIWNVHGRKGSIADFMKGMIKLGAAAIKFKLNHPMSGRAHLARAMELFDFVKSLEGSEFLGFDLEELSQKIAGSIDSGNVVFKIHPHWE